MRGNGEGGGWRVCWHMLTLPPPTRWIWAGPQVRKVAEDNGVDVSPQIAELEQRAKQVGVLMRMGWHGREQGFAQSMLGAPAWPVLPALRPPPPNARTPPAPRSCARRPTAG